MVINKQMALCLIIVGLVVLEGRTHWDFPHSNNVAQCKTMLSTQSVEQVGALIDALGIVTWRKKIALEELSQRNTPRSLQEIDRLNSKLSAKLDVDSRELCAKIAVDAIRRTCKTETEQVAALGAILDSTSRENSYNAREASRELSLIGTSLAREVLIAKEAKWPIITRIARLGLEIINLDVEAAVGLLLDSAYQDLHTPEIEGVAKLVAERLHFQSLINRDGKAVLLQVVRRQTQFQGQNIQQSAVDRRYITFLQELRVDAEKSEKKKEIDVKQPTDDPNRNAQNRDRLSNTPPVTSNAAPTKAVAPISSSRPDREAFMRSEERGEDYSGKDSKTLISILSQSKDKIELKKATKVLGDRSIAGTLKLTESEKASMTNIVQICLMKELDVDSQEDARELIERLWWTAVPGLLNNIANEKPAIREIALKSLSLMRNEEIIRSLMDIAKQSPHEPTRMMAIFALGNMTEKRGSLIPGRLCMDEATSRELAEKQIRPFLNTLLATEKNAEMKALLGRALNTLDVAPDRRPVRVPNK
jgi:hypothetical protein